MAQQNYPGRPTQLAAVACYSGVFLMAAFAQPTGIGVISGTVVDAESGDPIRKAIVTLTLEGTPRRWATARTDSSGHFVFEALPAGKYDLGALKGNEGTAVYGANSLRELGGLITLGDGESLGPIKLRLIHPASISGHVYDSDGEPVADVSVHILRQGRNLGAPILVNYREGTTDDRGEYRISEIDPGRYYLRASASGAGQFGNFGANHQEKLVEQYYRGIREGKDATAVHVRGGESLTGLDFHLVTEPVVEVRGQIIGVPEEADAPQTDSEGVVAVTRVGPRRLVAGGGRGVEVRISPAEFGQGQWSNGTVAQGPDYRFQLGGLASGRYRIEAEIESKGRTYGASQVFDFRQGSNEVQLTLAPALDIQGTLRVEGQAPAREETPAVARPYRNGFLVQLTRPGGSIRQGNVSAQVGADGRFTISQVAPGDWQLSVTPVPPGYLKSAQFGDKDVRFTAFEVAGGNATLNIVVSMQTSTVEGQVEAGQSKAKRAGVLLAPVGAYHNLARFYYGTAADDDGKFKLRGIAPGRYKIFAVEKMAADSFRNPEAADQLDQFGELIDVPEGVTLEAHPKLIPADRAAKAIE